MNYVEYSWDSFFIDLSTEIWKKPRNEISHNVFTPVLVGIYLETHIFIKVNKTYIRLNINIYKYMDLPLNENDVPIPFRHKLLQIIKFCDSYLWVFVTYG